MILPIINAQNIIFSILDTLNINNNNTNKNDNKKVIYLIHPNFFLSF